MAAKRPAKRRKALKKGKKLSSQKTLTSLSDFSISKPVDVASTKLF